MTLPSKPPDATSVWDDPRLRVPSAEAWAKMSPDEREAAGEAIEAVLNEHIAVMSEGVRHFRRKAAIRAELDAHYQRAGRQVFLACELAVLYPGEPLIVPDVMAVMDWDARFEPERWVVQDLKRGIDLVIEVRNMGRKHKDLVAAVKEYAHLGIPEYFSYDCRRGTLHGWRLPVAGARVYQPIVPQGGLLLSTVLGLDLGLVDKRLRFFANRSLVEDDGELLTRAQAALDHQQSALEQQQNALDQAAAVNARTRAALAASILTVLRLRGLTVPPEAEARITTEQDSALLARWAADALTAVDVVRLFDEQ